MIRIALVEDDLACCRQMEEYLIRYAQETGEELSTQVFRDGEDILRDYRAKYDIILMDVQMEHMDGMTAAEEIRKLDGEAVIIFITSLASYAIKGYAVNALDYIVKPVSYYAFSQSLRRALGQLRRRTRTYLLVNYKNIAQKIDSAGIYYIEVDGHNLVYHTTDGDITAPGAMRDVESKLADSPFFRCNKGYLVNMVHVDGVVEDDAVIHGIRLQISRAKKRAFMDALNRYINEVD